MSLTCEEGGPKSTLKTGLRSLAPAVTPIRFKFYEDGALSEETSRVAGLILRRGFTQSAPIRFPCQAKIKLNYGISNQAAVAMRRRTASLQPAGPWRSAR